VAEVTYYVALPFGCERRRCGGWRALGMLQSVAVVMRAEALSRREATSAPSRLAALATLPTGNFSDARVIKKFGDVPEDLSAL
jgi:hypothetical protein